MVLYKQKHMETKKVMDYQIRQAWSQNFGKLKFINMIAIFWDCNINKQLDLFKTC